MHSQCQNGFMSELNKIVFYDGDCGLCQRSVRWLLKWDHKKQLSFAPLNGSTYKSLFETASDLNTLVYYKDAQSFIKSEAFIKICQTLGGVKSLAVVLRLIPRFIRDAIYDFIASERKKVSCVILVKDERFLL